MKRALSLLSLALGLLIGGLLATGTVNIRAQNATDCATPVDSGPVTSGQRFSADPTTRNSQRPQRA